MCEIEKKMYKAIEDLFEDIRNRDKKNGPILSCCICGGKPAFTKERYTDLYGFNHTCKGISPQIHIKSEGYPSMYAAKNAWNRWLGDYLTDEQYPVDDTGVEIDPRGGSGGMVLGGKVVQRWK